MIHNDKHIFWEALVIAVFIFGIGVLLGLLIENSRVSEISGMYLESEINLLDMKIQTEIINTGELNCEVAITKNIEFANRVYEEAKILDRYDSATRITDEIVQQHRKYDLLRTLLWVNSVKLKENCENEKFHTLVYLYNYRPEEQVEKAKQSVFSRFLEEIKQDAGEEVVLIPIARNMDISSLDIITTRYGINETSIILNEEIVITDARDLHEIREAIALNKF